MSDPRTEQGIGDMMREMATEKLTVEVEGLRRERDSLAGKLEEHTRVLEVAIKELQSIRQTIFEERGTRERMRAILTATAAALKGEPGELGAHSWYDLRGMVKALVQRAEKAEQALAAECESHGRDCERLTASLAREEKLCEALRKAIPEDYATAVEIDAALAESEKARGGR